MNYESVRILLVEDNPGEARLLLEALKDGNPSPTVDVLADGMEALAYLRRQGRYAEAPRPHLLLLDLNLPRKDGREVLAEMKADPDLRRIPVVILTNSRADEDVFCAYDLHANCYVPKPVGFEEFTTVVRKIEDFWFTIARLSVR